MLTQAKRKLKKRKSPLRSRHRRSYTTTEKDENKLSLWVWVGFCVVLGVISYIAVSSFPNTTTHRGRALQGGGNLNYDPVIVPPIPVAFPVASASETGSAVVFFLITITILIVILIASVNRHGA